MGVSKEPKPTTPYGSDNFDDLVYIVRPARGRMYMCAIAYPQSFGANAPPTWGQSMITTKFIWLKSVISTYARFAS